MSFLPISASSPTILLKIPIKSISLWCHGTRSVTISSKRQLYDCHPEESQQTLSRARCVVFSNILNNILTVLQQWLDTVLSNRFHRPKTLLARRYFSATSIQIRNCDAISEKPSTALEHWQLSATERFSRTVWLRRHAHPAFNGRVYDLITNRFSAHPVVEPLSGCWRVGDADRYCEGTATFQEVTTGLPVILALEMEPDDIHNESLIWDFPEVIGLPADPTNTNMSKRKSAAAASSPSKRSQMQMPFVYQLVGCVFMDETEGGHFIVRETRDGTRVQEYNDLQGGAVKQLSTKLKLKDAIAGSSHRDGSTSHGRLHVVTAYYTLKGGLDSQRKFRDMRLQTLEQRYNIVLSRETAQLPSVVSFTKPRVRHLTESELVWLSSQKRRALTTLDFVQLVTPGPMSPSPSGIQTEPDTIMMDMDVHATALVKPKLQSNVPARRRIESGSSESLSSLEDFGVEARKRIPVKSQKTHANDLPTKARTCSPSTPPQLESLSFKKHAVRSPRNDSGKYRIQCRCGVDEWRDSNEECEQDIIACTECGDWSHHACHLLGWTYDLGEDDIYSCFWCDGFQQLRIPTKTRSALTK